VVAFDWFETAILLNSVFAALACALAAIPRPHPAA
jgi:hypothetical protein